MCFCIPQAQEGKTKFRVFRNVRYLLGQNIPVVVRNAPGASLGECILAMSWRSPGDVLMVFCGPPRELLVVCGLSPGGLLVVSWGFPGALSVVWSPGVVVVT